MKYIREEIRQESAFRILHTRDIGDKAECGSVPYGANHCVQADFLKILPERFGSDPVVP